MRYGTVDDAAGHAAQHVRDQWGRKMKFRVVTISAVAAALLLTGCGPTSPEDKPEKAKKAAPIAAVGEATIQGPLWTKTEIEALVGDKVTADAKSPSKYEKSSDPATIKLNAKLEECFNAPDVNWTRGDSVGQWDGPMFDYAVEKESFAIEFLSSAAPTRGDGAAEAAVLIPAADCMVDPMTDIFSMVASEAGAGLSPVTVTQLTGTNLPKGAFALKFSANLLGVDREVPVDIIQITSGSGNIVAIYTVLMINGNASDEGFISALTTSIRNKANNM